MGQILASLGVKSAVVTVVLLVLFQSPVNAVDIEGYPEGGACKGPSQTCKGIPVNTCCLLDPVQAVAFWGLTQSQAGRVYRDAGCNTEPAFSKDGPGDFCVSGGGTVHGASYIEKSSASSTTAYASTGTSAGTESNDAPACESSMLPNAVAYTTSSDAFEGKWVLEAEFEKIPAILEQLESIAEDQKVAWMQRAGAKFTPSSFEM